MSNIVTAQNGDAMDDLVIFGTGGFARETHQIVDDLNQDVAKWHLLGFLDEDVENHNAELYGLPVLGGAKWVKQNPQAAIVVAIANPAIRRRIVLDLLQAGHTRFATLIHPLVWMSNGVDIGPGTVIDAGALISPDVRIGDHVILNNNCTIGHDTVVESYATIAPNASVSGKVLVGQGCDLGANCTIIQERSIGGWSIIGAGAVVVQDVPSNVTAVGVPAKVIKKRAQGWYER